MPVWCLKIAWRIRGRRLVRIHQKDGLPSIEGVLVGVAAKRYVVLSAVMLGDGGATELAGHVEVPKENVMLVQVLP